MALTVTNTDTLRLLSILNNTSTQQSRTLQRLATGFRINTGADDPAGLIALTSLQAEITAVDSAIDNSQRADALLTVADGALGEVGKLLSEVESLVAASTSAGGLSPAEVAANQAQIDAAINSIDRIVRTTTFNGKRLLDGSQAISRSSVNNSQITNLRLFSRGNISSNLTATVDVTTAAARASHTLVDTEGASNVTSGTTVLSVRGSLGTAEVTIGDDSNAAAIAAAINQSSDLTGVAASATNGVVTTYSTQFGESQVVSVEVLSGGNLQAGQSSNTFAGTDGNVTGTDAAVLVNGQAASVDGLQVFFNVGGVSGSFNLTESFGTQTSTNSTFTIGTSGGATFQLGTDASTRSTIGIDALFSSNLGGGDTGGVLSDLKSGGSASLGNDVETALNVVRRAISDVATARGRVGAFQKFQVQTSVNTLNTTKASLSSAASLIGDTDFARETAEFNRQNVLLNTSVALLGLANQRSQSVLALLGG